MSGAIQESSKVALGLDRGLAEIAGLLTRESANFWALRPNDGYQKFGPSLGSEIRLFTPTRFSSGGILTSLDIAPGG